MRVKNKHTLSRVLTTIANVAIAFSHHQGRNAKIIYAAAREFEELQDVTDRELYRSVYHAIGKKYLEITPRRGGGAIRLTEAGKDVVGRAAIRALRPVVPAVWDGKWRLVLFDIPESHKQSRDGFAGSLKLLGFTPIQKSAFVFPYDCFEQVAAVADFYDVRDHAAFIMVEKLDRSAPLRRIYNLKSGRR